LSLRQSQDILEYILAPYIEGGKGGVPITHHAEFFFIKLRITENFFPQITRHVKRRKQIDNFTFLTLKVSLKEELCRFNHKNASANM